MDTMVLDDSSLVTLIESEVSQSIGMWQGDLSGARARELDYYNGEPFGNEVEGESQVVSTDVFDVVEALLPSLLRIFTSSDDVVRFEATGPEDEEAAAQRTDVCNYVFYRQNNGFLVLYEWFKDALIQKNGIVKYWWEEKTSTTKQEYRDLSEGQVLKFKQDPNIEIVRDDMHDDTVMMQQRDDQLAQVLQQVKQQAQGNPQVEAQLTAEIKARIGQIKIPQLHDVELRVTKDVSKVCIETVPPEEFGISQRHKCVSIQDTPFCYHKKRMYISELREMGCPEDVIDTIGSGDDRQDLSPESLARDRFLDQAYKPAQATDPSMRQVWVTDCFIRLDWDGDGIAELRHVIKAGSAIWINEETDHINFAALTPIIMPHRWVGKSLAELVMSDQFVKSVIWRQMLNNLYLTNNPRKAVLSSPSGIVQANLDDLMNSRAGAIMREYTPGAIRNEETPFVAGAAFPMLEYIDSQKEKRTGVTAYNQGTDADSLNKTARGISLIQTASQQHQDLIARIFAETGVKDLMRGIAYMLSKYSSKAMTVRLRNKWVEIDPREWDTQYDMTVNVGLGTGNKDSQIAHLNAMGESQVMLMQEGRGYLVTDENIYNVHQKRAEAMGFKHPEMFVSDPKSVQKPPPAPNPDMVKVQQQHAEAQMKIQSNEKIRQFDANTEQQLEIIRQEGAKQLALIDAQTKRELEQMRIGSEHQLTVFKENNAMQKEVVKAKAAAPAIGAGGSDQNGLGKQVEDVIQAQAQAIAQQHIDALNAQNDQRHQQHADFSQQMMQSVTQAMQQVAAGINGLALNLNGIQTILGESALLQAQSRDLLLNPPPRNVTLGEIQKNAKGEITGAVVTPKIGGTETLQ